MVELGPSELFIVLSYMLTFAAWTYLVARGGKLQTLVLLALLATLIPIIGPIIIFLFYRPRGKEKRK